MLVGWAAEGVGTSRVARLKGKLPGIYMIQTDAFGDRRFFHWRESAAARSLMDLPETDDILDSLATYDVVYLSAITLSIYSPQGRTKLIGALGTRPKAWRPHRLRHQFPRPWLARSRRRTRRLRRSVCGIRYRAGFARGFAAALSRRKRRTADGAHSLQRSGAETSRAPASIVRFDGVSQEVRPEPITQPVVDTTAAGDSFSAAYIAARLAGAEPVEAARAGHRLGGVVVCYPGAIIPRSAMPANILPGPGSTRKASR